MSLAVEHWLTAGEIAAQAGEFDIAQTGFERVLDFPLNKLESSSLIRSYEGLANTYIQSGKMEQAADILAELAKHYDSRNHPDQALQALQRAHQLIPEQRRHLEQLCQAYMKVGQEEEYIRSSLRLAKLLLNQDLFGRAEALYRTLRGLPRWEETSTSPDQGDPCYRNIVDPLLELCLDKGATEDAIELLSDLARRYETAGEIPQALEQIERIHKVRPDHEPALEWQAEIFIREDRKPEALKTFERLANLEEGKGYYSKAIDHHLRMLDLDPNSPNALMLLNA